MKNLLNKITRAAIAVFAVIVGFVMAALGFTFIAFLAMFALAVVGLAMIAAPIIARNQKDKEHDVRFANAFHA